MDQPDRGPNDKGHAADGSATGGLQSVELEKVKQALAVKVEKHGAHYTDMAPIGKGSFGEVHSARDALLGREVAIKSLKQDFREREDVVNRFLREVRGTAQLEHPNVMPVHEMGMSDDLGIYFTMKKIDGEDLKAILDKLQGNTAFYEKRYSLHFLLEVFLSVCNGVSYAHSRGVIHRDLKPANIMVGQYGEVLILDWGLVKHIGEEEPGGKGVHLEMDETAGGMMTMDGAVSGTPNYMSPEQADGRIKDIDFQSDVYSLGAILYHILTYYPPFEKTRIHKLLENVRNGIFTPPRTRFPERGISRELEAICLKAMARLPVSRYRSVEDLAQDVRNYIGNYDVKAYKAPRWVRFWKACKRHPVKAGVTAAAAVVLLLAFGTQRAMLYGSYSSNMRRADDLKQKGNEKTDQALVLYDQLQQLNAANEFKETTAEERDLLSRFEERSREAAANFNIAEMLYESVPRIYRSRTAVRDGYVEVMRRRIDFALHCGQYDQARQWLRTIRLRLQQPDMAREASHTEQLEAVEHRIDGEGMLEVTGPESVQHVMVWPLFDSDDEPRMILGDAIKRGSLPFTMEAIDKGSYVLQISLSSGGMMHYPIYIAHGEKKQVELVLPEAVPEGMVYVPGGDFIFGGEDSRFYREQRRTLPAFYISKHEVTVAEYLEFWKSLTDPDLKSAYMSRIRFHSQERHFVDAWDEQGHLKDERLKAEYPVVGITPEAARVFCMWKSRQTQSRIRLPTAEEWEKAARGVDGRKYVWGNGYSAEASLALTKGNFRGKERFPLWAPPESFSRDITVYGALDMGGNVREMTCTLLPNSTEFYQLKGGSASTPENFLPCSYSSDTPVAPSDVGFRYIQEIGEKP